MAQAMHAEILDHKREIHNSRAHTLAVFHRLISKLDETAEWPRIIHEAREAGLTKEILVNELSCAWSTILRWQAGHTAPGPFARQAIKARVLELIAAEREAELRRAESPS